MNTYGLLNCLSENSVKQSVCSIKKLVSEGKKVGATHIALTDNNTMTGVIEFYNECIKQSIEPIIGCKFLIMDEMLHSSNIVLLAKNYEGYIELSQLMYIMNNRIKEGGKDAYILFDDLETVCQTNNIIALTGAKKDILGTIIHNNEQIITKLNKLKESQVELSSPYDSAYLKNKEIHQEYTDKISILDEKIKKVGALAGKKYKKQLKGLDSLKNSDPVLYKEKFYVIQNEIKETEIAKIELLNLKSQISSLKKTRTSISKKIDEMKKHHYRFNAIEKEIKDLNQLLLDDKDVFERCTYVIKRLKDIFGNDLYLQMYNDGTSEGKKAGYLISDLSKKYDCKTFITCVVNMATKEDVESFKIMKSIQNEEWLELEEGEESLYIKSYDILYNEYSTTYSENITTTALLGNVEICNKCHFRIPPTKHYPKYIDDSGNICNDSAALLRKKATEGIINRGFTKETFTSIYIERFEKELNTIIEMGFADYLLIVADFVNYGKKRSKANNEYGIGYGTSPGRGSAVGSLICFLLEITDIDPLKYSLKFERFLNVDRISMPDIDTDYAVEIRNDVIEYAKNKYGNECVAMIRTLSTQKTKASIDNVIRLYGMKDGIELGKLIKKHLIENKTIEDCKTEILQNFKDSSNEKIIETILNKASLVENSITGLSIHAAGVIISDGKPLYEYVPLLYNTEINQWAVQCDMIEAEQLNLLKMDFLVLRTLDVITECLRRIKKYLGVTIDLNNIPFEKEVFDEIFSTGKTKSVFQLESIGMRNTLKNFKPQSIEDVILLVAAYRPGPMDFIPDIIKVKNGEETPYYCVPELEDILKPTYGYPIYQEQLMDIFSICAGFTQNEADIIRRYMSKKKVESFIAYKDKFINGLISNGASVDDANELWTSLVDFSKYAFNKSHATAYAVVAYQTAYLKYYYSEYYMCAALNNADIKKIPQLLEECKEMGIKIFSPDINQSGENFENVEKGIIYGLCKIKGINNKAKIIIKERENGHFSSFKEFVYRIGGEYGLIKDLILAGAMDIFLEDNREQLINAYNPLKEIVSVLKIKEAEYNELNNINCDLLQKKEQKEHEKKLAIAKSKLDEVIKAYKNFEFEKCAFDEDDLLLKERELLGGYISVHPLDAYKHLYKNPHIALISDFTEEYKNYIGIIQDIRYAKRKKDGKDMAFFSLFDISGSINVCCYTKPYEKYKDFIKENNIVKIRAKGIIDTTRDNECENKLVVESIEKCTTHKKPILISIPDISYEVDAYNILKEYEDVSGHPIWLQYVNNGLISVKKMNVNKKVFDLNYNFLKISLLFTEK